MRWAGDAPFANGASARGAGATGRGALGGGGMGMVPGGMGVDVVVGVVVRVLGGAY